MKRQAGISALLLVCVGVVLGATVFRSNIAQATGLAQSVTVNNTSANPVPVREQNLDGQNVRVHEEGTAPVAAVAANDAKEFLGFVSGQQAQASLGETINATLIVVHMDDGFRGVTLSSGDGVVSIPLLGPGSVQDGEAQGQNHYVLALNQPMPIDTVLAECPSGHPGCGHFDVRLVGSSG